MLLLHPLSPARVHEQEDILNTNQKELRIYLKRTWSTLKRSKAMTTWRALGMEPSLCKPSMQHPKLIDISNESLKQRSTNAWLELAKSVSIVWIQIKFWLSLNWKGGHESTLCKPKVGRAIIQKTFINRKRSKYLLLAHQRSLSMIKHMHLLKGIAIIRLKWEQLFWICKLVLLQN